MFRSNLGVSSCVLAAALAWGACASAEPAPPEVQSSLRVTSSDAVLLTSSGALEIHVRDGRVFELTPAAIPGERARTRAIQDLDDLRLIYEKTGMAMPEAGPDGSIQVNGWIGLECVRLGQACGRVPEDGAPQVMVLIRGN